MDFKKVSEITAVAVPFLIVCSSVYLTTYYSHWNIPIFEYLSTAEILFLFIWPVLTILLLAGSYILITGVFMGAVTALVMWTSRFQKSAAKADTEVPAIEKPRSLLSILWQYFVMVAIAVLFPLIFLRGIWYDYEILPAIILHVFIWALALKLLLKLAPAAGVEPGLGIHFAAVMLTLLSASFFYGRYQAHFAVTDPVAQTIVLTDGMSFITDANVIYLGKTSGFYFYYNTAEKEALILPAAQIKSVSIKQAN